MHIPQSTILGRGRRNPFLVQELGARDRPGRLRFLALESVDKGARLPKLPLGEMPIDLPDAVEDQTAARGELLRALVSENPSSSVIEDNMCAHIPMTRSPVQSLTTMAAISSE